jgi:hypothetical protein
MTVKLQLGDIIQISAPNDTDIHEHIYHIAYLDENKIRLEEADGTEQILTLTYGNLDNEAIESIIIKSRAEEVGYARQNNLLIGVWIDIHFSGDLPLTLTGKITNLEKDKIEITTFPENDVIFIDFEYKGLPEDLPIEKIQIRKAPDVSMEQAQAEQAPGEKGEQAQAEKQAEQQAEQQAEGEQGEGSIEALEKKYKALQQQLLEMPEEEITLENLEFERQKEIQEQTRNFIFNADQIRFGEDLEAITQLVDVPEEEQRYDIDKQLDDLLDDMLSTIPNAKRTDAVKNNIHKMIQRFKQLRDNFSVFDEKGYALLPKAHGPNYKPLVGVMEKFEKQLYWLLPVVKNIKKIYNEADTEEEIEGEEDIELIDFAENMKAEKEIVNRYEANTATETNKYALLQRELNPYLTPYLNPPETLPINTNITTLVDNLGDFNSSVQGTDTFTTPHSANNYERIRKIQQKRFALLNYTIGTSGLEIIKVRGDNPLVKRKELTKNERLNLKALVTLPEPVVRFSRINLQTALMLDKANLNLHYLNYWQLLKESTKVSKAQEHSADTFLKTIRNFTVGDGENYSSFLNTVIPKTKILFNFIKPYLVGKLSINAILTYLEPFMIYQEDLNASQYKEMTDYIREKILEYRKQYATKSREYANIKGTQNVLIPSLLKILDENTSLRAKVLDVYGFTDTIMNMNNADFIKRIYEIDDGVFYNNAIALISTNLMIADGTRDMADIDIYLNKAAAGPPPTAKTKKTTQVAPTENACKKVIAKRYIEIDELNEDNGKEIYFDKKYDTTDYTLRKADSRLSQQDQLQHYIDQLIKTKDEPSARRDAQAILRGQRTVENGEYALLETTDETSATIQYYVRQQDTWVLDETMDSETFADSMKMFCNLNEKCIAVKDKCEDQETGANELKKQNLKLLLTEFNTALNVSKDIITNRIEDELGSADARIDTLRKIRLTQMYKYETKKIELANTLEETSVNVVSPYDGLLNNILASTDVAKRYLNISNFVKTFTREGLTENDESHYWRYCIKSNKKMLPTFIYTLATTFLTGGNFGQMLDTICALQGTLSDDGDKYVDKYSGYTIRMIEMSTDEEYNEEGFKIITRSVMEEDTGDALLAALKTLPVGAPAAMKQKFATPDATTIYNVIEAMSANMGLNLEDQKDFIVRNVLKQLSNTSVMPSQTAYAKLFAAMQAKNKKMDTYEVAYNSTLLFLTFAYYLIAIQTSIPPIKTKTTFPGCKKSFSGFPLDADTSDTKGLNYVACVAFKLRNKAALPWSAIANQRGEELIAKQMEGYITKYILPTEEVQNSIKQWKLYRAGNPEPIIPPEHMLETWVSFLPPLKQLKMLTTQDVGDVFKERLSVSLRKGQKAQEDYIAELHSKMLQFSFHIIDLIEKTVHGEQAILRGKNGEPYMENACCDTGEKNTIKYFVKKQPDIAVYNNKVVRLSDMYDDARKLAKAVLLYDPSNTKRKLREIENKFSEQTIYRAFIVYCRFNSLIPVSDNMKAICPTKPDNFDANDTLEESIRKMKSNARNYSEQSLQQLLEVINNSTKKSLKIEEKVVANTTQLAEIMAQMDAENKRPSAFRAAFMDIIDTFEINALLEDTAALRKFKNILAKLNDDMQKQITEFVGQANVKDANLIKFNNCLNTIVQFKETGNNLILGKEAETGFKMINFMKKTMRSLTREFPNIIINAVKYDNVMPPIHWKLSPTHMLDVKNIVKTHYTAFALFYQDDQIRLLMEKMLEVTSDVNALAQNTLCYAPVELKTKQPAGSAEKKAEKYSAFDLDLTTLLFKFYFFNVLADLIALQNDTEILGLPLKNLDAEEEEESFLSKANERDILIGNKTELGEKIAALIVVFTNFICQDKSAIDYNYKSLMEMVLRSKEKEKDEITDYLGKMTVEERAVENLFKKNKLGRWSKGEQKGIHTYQGETYDEEREEMEKIATREVKLNKRNVVTDMNRDIFALDMLNEEAADEGQDQEDNMITYMGEDAEPEDYEMDGDENY